MAPRHHTVPQMYLRYFANSSKQVVIVSRDDPSLRHRIAVKNAVTEVGFYRIEVDEIERAEDRATFDPEGIEHGLSGIEGAAAPTLDKVIATGVDELTLWEQYQLFQFIAVQTARGQGWRDDVTALLNHAARTEFLSNLTADRAQEWLVEQGKPHAPEDVEAYLKVVTSSPFASIVVPKAILVQESLKMALGTDDRVGIARFLTGRRVRLIKSTNAAVLTSDEPVCWWSPGDVPIGYANAQVVWLPLTPRLILQLSLPTFEEKDVLGLDEDDEIVRFINMQVAGQARRWIVHHPDDSPLNGVVLPPRQVWADELVGVEEDGDERRELWIHRRLGQDFNAPPTVP